MTSIIRTQPMPTARDLTVRARPSRKRRAALVVAGVLACALPLVFTFNITRMLATGVLPDHRFHQLTGQGEVLCALWLGPLLALLHAGWQGRRPGTWAGHLHLSLIAAGIVCAAAAPGGGAPSLVTIVAVTGALLWAVLPQRPRLRASVQVDPLLAPVALVGSALLLRYAVGQVALQNATTTGHHVQNPHFFDQAWIAVTLACIALLAALMPADRNLARWMVGSLVTLGVAGLALGESTPLFAAFLGLGVAAGLADLVVRRRPAGSGAC